MKKRTFLAVLVLLAIAVTGVAVLAGSGDGPASDLVTREFTITGMTCGGCAAGVKLTLKRLEGVSEVEVSYEDGNAVVTYDPAETSDEKIITAIKKLGYEATVKDTPAPKKG